MEEGGNSYKSQQPNFFQAPSSMSGEILILLLPMPIAQERVDHLREIADYNHTALQQEEKKKSAISQRFSNDDHHRREVGG